MQSVGCRGRVRVRVSKMAVDTGQAGMMQEWRVGWFSQRLSNVHVHNKPVYHGGAKTQGRTEKGGLKQTEQPTFALVPVVQGFPDTTFDKSNPRGLHSGLYSVMALTIAVHPECGPANKF